MGHYGQMAMEFSRAHRPISHGQITDPTAHFEAMGRQIAAEVIRVRDEILGGPRPDEEPETSRTAARRHWQRLARSCCLLVNEGRPSLGSCSWGTSPSWHFRSTG